MTTHVNVGAVPPQQGAAGTQGEHHPNSTTNVHINPQIGAIPVAPHGHRGHDRERESSNGVWNAFLGILLFCLVVGVSFLALLGVLALVGFPENMQGIPGASSTASAPAVADPGVSPAAPAPANVALDPLPAPPYTREVPVHDGSNVLCEVTLAGPEAVLGNDEAVMSFVKTNETSLCTSAEGALTWNGESITWKRGS